MSGVGEAVMMMLPNGTYLYPRKFLERLSRRA